jgi:hypothetical protein
MKVYKLTLLAIAAFFCLIACQNQATETTTKKEKKKAKKEMKAAPNTISQKEIKEGWKLLFDGKTFENWRGYNMEGIPTEGWEIKDGAMAGFGGGDLITKEQYENFELSLEFNMTEAANSGIFYFAQEIEGKRIYASAPEYQLIDNQTYIELQGADVMHKHLTGDVFNVYDGVINPGIGKETWHHARIKIKDNHVEHWLNGKLCIEYDWDSADWKESVANSGFNPELFGKKNKGHIGLQFHANKTRFRNIKIRTL